MIAIDTNILVYAHRSDSEWHSRARSCLRSLAEGRGQWGIPWACLHEFLAIVTHPRIYDPPSAIEAAVDQVDAWLEAPGTELLGESGAHWELLSETLCHGRIQGPIVHDARVASTCIGHGVTELWTADRDFGRFPRLQVRNPLIEEHPDPCLARKSSRSLG
ncbi:MAG: PIN domain-containing protein [Alphaproteobacteria bacterium]|nr:PIN domain-containing protein [Alphaproteobacteria bacterium]